MKIGDIINKINKFSKDRYLRKKKYKFENELMLKPKYLNVGGGNFVREHWQVLDSLVSDRYNHLPALIDYNIDLEEIQEWGDIKDGFFDAVYCSHTLEHLNIEGVRNTLKESYRILNPKGTIRIVVPDLGLARKHYKANNKEWFEKIYPYIKNETIDQDLDYFAHSYYLSKKPNNSLHKNGFDFRQMKYLLKEAGFKNIIKSQCGKSKVTELCFLDVVRPEMSLYAEAKKR